VVGRRLRRMAELYGRIGDVYITEAVHSRDGIILIMRDSSDAQLMRVIHIIGRSQTLTLHLHLSTNLFCLSVSETEH